VAVGKRGAATKKQSPLRKQYFNLSKKMHFIGKKLTYLQKNANVRLKTGDFMDKIDSIEILNSNNPICQKIIIATSFPNASLIPLIRYYIPVSASS